MARTETIDEHRRIIELYEISDKEFIESLKPFSTGTSLTNFGTSEYSKGSGTSQSGGVTLDDTIVQNIIPIVEAGGTFEIDWSKGNIFTITLRKDAEIKFIGVPGNYQLIHIKIQNSSNWDVTTWPDSLVEVPTINKKSETMVALVSFGDGYVHFVTNLASATGIRNASEIEDFTLDLSKIKTVSADAGHVVISGGKTIPTYWGALNNIAGKLDLSKITIDIDLDLQLKKLKNLKRITLAEETETPADNGSIYRVAKDLKIRSNDGVINLSVIPDLLKKDLSNISGAIPMSKLSDIPSSKIKSGILNIGRIPDIPSSKITGLSSINSLVNLSEFTAAVGGIASYLSTPLGMDIRNLGKIKFNTARESSIGTYDSIKVKYLDPDDDTKYKAAIEQVMNFYIHGEKAVAISALADSFVSTPYDSVFEIFGKKHASLKIVDTQRYKVPSSVGSVEIGSISFDALAPYTADNSLDFVQSTFAQIKVKAETKKISGYPEFDINKVYHRGLRVSYNNKEYIYLNPIPSSGKYPAVKYNGKDFWYQVSTTSLEKGKLEFILMDKKSALTTSDDSARIMISIDQDSGLYIDSHLTTKDDAYVNLNVIVNLGGSINGVTNIFGSLNLYNKGDNNLPTINGEFKLVNKEIKYKSGDIVRTLGEQGSGGGSSGFDPTSIDKDMLPDKTDARSIGSSVKNFLSGYFKFLQVTTRMNTSDLSVNGKLQVNGDLIMGSNRYISLISAQGGSGIKPPSNAAGYFNIKVAGVLKKVYFYN